MSKLLTSLKLNSKEIKFGDKNDCKATIITEKKEYKNPGIYEFKVDNEKILSIQFKIWGAGGGSSDNIVSGGNGGFTLLNIIPVLNDTFYLSVGYPGKNDGTIDGSVLKGGLGTKVDDFIFTASGGNGSLVAKYEENKYNVLGIAGGGGGACKILWNLTYFRYKGGNAGGIFGENGYYSFSATPSIGGNSGVGGIGGITASNNGQSGSDCILNADTLELLGGHGGDGYNSINRGGSGGGGGYGGGGGGICIEGSASSGAGGAGYVSNGTLYENLNIEDEDYISGFGVGGLNGNGGNGLIIMNIQKEVMYTEEMKIDNITLNNILLSTMRFINNYNIENGGTLDTNYSFYILKSGVNSINLPSVNLISGFIYIIVPLDVGGVTINANGTETFGNTGLSTLVVTQKQLCILIADGITEWLYIKV